LAVKRVSFAAGHTFLGAKSVFYNKDDPKEKKKETDF
jgi:hypothetical protein